MTTLAVGTATGEHSVLGNIAIAKIKAYVGDSTRSAPSIQDYINAGVTGVSISNLDKMNDRIALLKPQQTKTPLLRYKPLSIQLL